MRPPRAASPETGWVFYTFFKVHRHFCVVLVYSSLSRPMSLPAAGMSLEPCGWLDWYPRTRSGASALRWWHRDTECEPSERRADYYYTSAAAAAAVDTGERRCCIAETAKERRRAPTSGEPPNSCGSVGLDVGHSLRLAKSSQEKLVRTHLLMHD